MSELYVGGEVESYCNSCKGLHWHVIVALVGEKPVRVECRSCKKQHGFRLGPPGSVESKAAAKPRSTAGKRAAVTTKASVDLSQLDRRAHEAKPYAPATTFAAGDIIRHPSFGLGMVVTLAGPQRVDVQFHGGPRTLVHDRNPAR